MKTNKPKFKIIFQTKENVWGNFNNKKKLKKQKWVKFVKKLDTIYNKNTRKRVKSLKLLYKHRLSNKQKFKSFYGNMSYSCLKRLFTKLKQKGSFNVIDKLIVLMEKRLDIFLFRVGLYSSIFESKQAINHKKINVNGRLVENGNYLLKEGDYISIPFKFEPINLPNIHINQDISLIVFLRDPKITEIKYPFSLNKSFLFEYLNKN
jgi:ribosomal protein S4